MRRANPSVSVGEAVHVDIAAWRYSPCTCGGAVVGIGIGDVDRLVKLAVCVPGIENVDAFRSLVIALPRFGPNRIAAERHFVGLDDLSLLQQLQSPVLFDNLDPIRTHWPGGGLRHGKGAQHPKSKSPESHAGIIVAGNASLTPGNFWEQGMATRFHE